MNGKKCWSKTSRRRKNIICIYNIHFFWVDSISFLIFPRRKKIKGGRWFSFFLNLFHWLIHIPQCAINSNCFRLYVFVFPLRDYSRLTEIKMTNARPRKSQSTNESLLQPPAQQKTIANRLIRSHQTSLPHSTAFHYNISISITPHQHSPHLKSIR